jgi:hypothetical protein
MAPGRLHGRSTRATTAAVPPADQALWRIAQQTSVAFEGFLVTGTESDCLLWPQPQSSRGSALLCRRAGDGRQLRLPETPSSTCGGMRRSVLHAGRGSRVHAVGASRTRPRRAFSAVPRQSSPGVCVQVSQGEYGHGMPPRGDPGWIGTLRGGQLRPSSVTAPRQMVPRKGLTVSPACATFGYMTGWESPDLDDGRLYVQTHAPCTAEPVRRCWAPFKARLL